MAGKVEVSTETDPENHENPDNPYEDEEDDEEDDKDAEEYDEVVEDPEWQEETAIQVFVYQDL